MANLLILGSLLPRYTPDFAFNVIKVFFHKGGVEILIAPLFACSLFSADSIILFENLD